MNWHVAFLIFCSAGGPIVYLIQKVLAGRKIRAVLTKQAEKAGLTVNSITAADRADHPWPKIRVIQGALITSNNHSRQTTFHCLLIVTNERGVEMELWARYERSPIPLVFGPPITEWRPPLDEVARATSQIEPVRDENRVIEHAKFGPFAKRRTR